MAKKAVANVWCDVPAPQTSFAPSGSWSEINLWESDLGKKPEQTKGWGVVVEEECLRGHRVCEDPEGKVLAF